VIAFGMITSEVGLVEVPHLKSPVGHITLADRMQLSPQPVPVPVPMYLVPGVITEGADLAGSDFMRGEETQIMGLLASDLASPPLLFVSPGSHGKFIGVGADGTILWSFTSLSGELVWALANETILARDLDPSLPLSDEEAADRGSAMEREAGLSRALYAGRLLSRMEGADAQTCSDFIRGAVASCDVRGLRSVAALPATVVVGSGRGLGSFYERLLRREPWVRSCGSTDLPLGALGAWALWRTKSEDQELS
jgi:2-dehydro-3-deoxygalactonokinase